MGSLEWPWRLFVTVALVWCVLSTAHAESPKKIVGYYYGKGRPHYQLSEVPVQKLTHLIYSHATPTAQGDCEMPHPEIDLPNLQALEALRVRNPKLLVLLSVGGWSGSRYFSDIAATSAARRHFSKSCLRIIEKYNLDGIDIDWEYPVTGGRPTDHKRRSDKKNFVLLLKQLRSDLNGLHHEGPTFLTIASTAYRNHLNDLSVKEMAEVLDWFNVMGYDFDAMKPNRTFHHSGLFAWPTTAGADTDEIKFANCDAAVRWYLDHGVPSEKIVLGLPFYGHIWANVPAEHNGIFQPYKGSPTDDGTLSYREIVQTYLPTYTRYWDDQAMVPWLYNRKTRVAISYEDPESITAKAKYVIQKKLGGIMFWDLGQDDSTSTLLNAIYKGLAARPTSEIRSGGTTANSPALQRRVAATDDQVPEGRLTSTQNVSGIVLNAMPLQEGKEFLFETARSVVFFLRVDVVDRGILLRNAHSERTVTRLPFKARLGDLV